MDEPTADQGVLIELIVEQLMRRHTTASVLFHHAAAERLRLGPTDHKCLDLLRERGTASGSELAAMTGLTTGAVTGVVARLEKAGYLRRKPDPHDRRKQILRPVAERIDEIHQLIAPLRTELADQLKRFDPHQLTAIAEFLAASTNLALRHATLLRAEPPTFEPKPTQPTTEAKL
jgi:DNA-binding MarR family transcriptional regulator